MSPLSANDTEQGLTPSRENIEVSPYEFEEGNGDLDLKSKIPELTSKKFIRDSGVVRDHF